MKNQMIITFALLLNIISYAQPKTVATKSVLIDDLILFMSENYSNQNKSQTRNITFLLQTSRSNLSLENTTIVKQAFRFLSKKLSANDKVSLVVYDGMNGIALNFTSSQNLKKILATINDLKSSISKNQTDGISIAYELANDNSSSANINTVVMIRNPQKEAVVGSVNTNQVPVKSKSNAVLITAISLLPELISIIKN